MKKLFFISALLMFFAAAAANAQGFYIGAGIGNTFFSSEIDDIVDEAQKIDENSTSWKIFGGIPLNNFLNIEGGYRNFGNLNANIQDVNVENKFYGWDVEALGRVQVSIIDIFAKAGVMFWTSEVSFLEFKSEDTGTDFLWGLGAGVHLGPIGVRLEYESLAVDSPDNLSMVSLSATLGF
jgi:OOP family OmpA-OmpF porin